ncbi:conserved exported protein of unknown function [Georgfuchsia toluolica]|uniref:Peptidoglycan-binding protein n=1 Tax=Georgfuchsia toluolica TaxID=424218 RepID=A0A916NIB2_9PROT|nr:DUF6448 family protein [Georgfuchsia toluolica]CAG4884321.1 conserved exported protein of unknown function [Georgfuchsia toluolica]
MKTFLVALMLAWAGAAFAHCDTLDGPVVTSARKALDSGNLNPALVWVRAADEAPIREAFAKALAVRKGGPAAQELADRYFFETLVRIHRMGEGADYTGLKPAGETHPAVAAADGSLRTGKLDRVDALVMERLRAALERSFHEVIERRAAAKDPNDVPAGRAAASAYVEYLHYVERLHDVAESPAAHGAPITHNHKEPS